MIGKRKAPRKAPEQVQIKPRRMDFRFRNVPRHWAGGDPVLTHLFNALSLTFPDGEQFFVDAVRAFRDRVTDPGRKRDIAGFIGQEAMHSKEHDTFNAMLQAQGYGELVESGQRYARERLENGRKLLAKQHQLAITAALEHITAILANGLLSNPDLLESLDPTVRDLWVWHAIEETEHKAVAYDLYMDLNPEYRERVGVFLSITSVLGAYTLAYTWEFLKADGVHRKPLTLARGAWRLFGWKGFITRLIPDYLDYLRPGFHPWDEDNTRLLEQWRSRLDQLNAYTRAAA